jgi:DNA polymerase II small subunit
MNTKDIIRFYIENNVLISPELVDIIIEQPLPIATAFSVITKDALTATEHSIPLDIDDFERAIVLKEKHHNIRMYQKFQEYLAQHITKESLQNTPPSVTQEITSNATTESKPDDKYVDTTDTSRMTFAQIEESKKPFIEKSRIKIISDYNEKSRKRTVADFVGHFNTRYRDIEKILRTRQELQNLTSIGRITSKREKEQVALIGYVYDKGVTKNNNIMLTLEDPTGFVKVVVTTKKEELFKLAEEIQLDEVIGVTGTYDQLIFANNIFIPDIPLTKELKKSPEEGYFLIFTDPQIGSKLFLEKEFLKLMDWINGRVGSDEQKDIASKLKYIFLVGDLVDGVGIYPDQEYHLAIIDVKDQYEACANYLKMIPPHLPIITCAGNHDVGRISEPQPRFHDEYSRPVWSLPNVIPVSNPSLINIFGSNEFEGFDVIMYHGYSFFYYFANVPSIRRNGGPKRPDLAMKYLLQRRHLAPSHTSNLYIPDPKKDPLTIERIPDFLFSGHIHRTAVSNYRNITCINASCWVSKSDEEERRGLEPQPARAFVVNMQTREVKVMNFLTKEEGEKEPDAKELVTA